MKVINHEAESLEIQRRREVSALKKAYYRLCFDQVEALKQARELTHLNTRVAALSLFGMMNWIYTWYNPNVDPEAGAVADQMMDLFLNGIAGFNAGRRGAGKASRSLFLDGMSNNGFKKPAQHSRRRASAARD